MLFAKAFLILSVFPTAVLSSSKEPSTQPYEVGACLPLAIVFLECFCLYLYESGLVFNDLFLSVEMTILSLIPSTNSTA